MFQGMLFDCHDYASAAPVHVRGLLIPILALGDKAALRERILATAWHAHASGCWPSISFIATSFRVSYAVAKSHVADLDADGLWPEREPDNEGCSDCPEWMADRSLAPNPEEIARMAGEIKAQAMKEKAAVGGGHTRPSRLEVRSWSVGVVLRRKGEKACEVPT